MRIRESFVNLTKGYRLGDPEWYEPYTDDRGELFRAMRHEYGRCTGRIYVDVPQGDASASPGVAAPAADRQAYVTETVGWVFEKRCAYEDAPDEHYIQEVWVEVQP